MAGRWSRLRRARSGRASAGRLLCRAGPETHRRRYFGLGAGQPGRGAARRRNRRRRGPGGARPHLARPPQRHPGAEVCRRLRVERLRPRPCRRRDRHADRRHLRADQPLALGAAQSARRGDRNPDRRALPALPQAGLPSRSSPLHARHPRRPGAARRRTRALGPDPGPACARYQRRGPTEPGAHHGRPASGSRSSPISAARSRRSSAPSADGKFVAAAVAIAERIAASLKSGGKVLLAGNGGSAADAQHIAAEFVGRFVNDRAPLAAIALTTDTSALTAIGNDYGFEHVFERQVRALGRKGDVFVGDLNLGPLAEHRRGAARRRASSASSMSASPGTRKPRCTPSAISCSRCLPKRPR